MLTILKRLNNYFYPILGKNCSCSFKFYRHFLSRIINLIEEYDRGTPNKPTVIVVLTHSHRPVDAQMQRDQDEVVEEEIDGLGPALHSGVSPSWPASSTPQLGEEEGAERVDFYSCAFARTPLHDQGQVEIHYLGRGSKRSTIQHIKK